MPDPAASPDASPPLRGRVVLLLAACLISVVVGVGHSVTEERSYRSQTVLLVQDDRPDAAATYERLLLEDDILKDTLRSLPVTHLRDLSGVAKDAWLPAFRDRFTIGRQADEPFLTVAYRSGDPQTAYHVINALVASSTRFLDSLRDTGAARQIEQLNAKRQTIDAALATAVRQLAAVRADAGLLMADAGQSVNVLSRQLLQQSDALVAAEQQATDAKSFYDAVRRSRSHGEDMTDYAARLDLTRPAGESAEALGSAVELIAAQRYRAAALAASNRQQQFDDMATAASNQQPALANVQALQTHIERLEADRAATVEQIHARQPSAPAASPLHQTSAARVDGAPIGQTAPTSVVFGLFAGLGSFLLGLTLFPRITRSTPDTAAIPTTSETEAEAAADSASVLTPSTIPFPTTSQASIDAASHSPIVPPTASPTAAPATSATGTSPAQLGRPLNIRRPAA